MHGPDVGDYERETFLYLFKDFTNACIAWMCHRCDPPPDNWLPHLAPGGGTGGVQSKGVTGQTHGLDKYERNLADVLLPDGTKVNHALVKDSLCWWYRTYAPGNTVLEGLEIEARSGQKGLWADPAPVPPWE